MWLDILKLIAGILLIALAISLINYALNWRINRMPGGEIGFCIIVSCWFTAALCLCSGISFILNALFGIDLL